MRIALIGYGKMGHEIEAAALEQGETIAGTFDIANPVDVAALADADICIEFSTPQTVLQKFASRSRRRRTSWSARRAGTTGFRKFAPW